MKLRNKQTGEIVENAYIRESHDFYNKRTIAVFIRNGNRPPERVSTGYETLAGLNAEWEDAPEPKGYWYIRDDGSGVGFSPLGDSTVAHRRLIIGNRFESEEESERALERFKAFTRLRDKGFRFNGWEDLQAEMDMDDLMLFNRDVINTDNVIGFRMDDYHDCIKDLNTCFGGEE